MLRIAMVVTLAWLAAGDEETFEIRGRLPRAGDAYRVSAESRWLNRVELGANVSRDLSARRDDYVQRVIAADGPGGRMTRAEREYQTAAEVTLPVGPEQDPPAQPELKPLPYQGKTMSLERQEKEWKVLVDGEASLNPAQARPLLAQLEAVDALLEPTWLIRPGKPVAVQEKWQVDLRAWVKFYQGVFGLEIDLARSAGQAKLLKTYLRDGRRFGVVQFTISAPLSREQTEWTLDETSRLTLDETLDFCLDGSVVTQTGSGQMSLRVSGVRKNAPDTRLLNVLEGTHRVEVVDRGQK
jgi:hypothetical protein